MNPRATEREGLQRLPGLLDTLFDQHDKTEIDLTPSVGGRRPDAVVRVGDRTWIVEVKRSGTPGVVVDAAQQLRQLTPDGAAPLLMVPFMTPAGAEAARAEGMNWVDFAGNARFVDDDLLISVRGNANVVAARGRPSSAFAPKSSRVARTLLLEPARWWRQTDLATHAGLDRGQVSRIVQRLTDDRLLDRDGDRFKASDPNLLLDAWADVYRFDHHDIVTGHLSGSGLELARDLGAKLDTADIEHAFTGLPAAWALDGFARFRLVSVYVEGDPRAAADAVELRRDARGANVQLVGPDDHGVFDGASRADGLAVAAAVQVYLDLGHLPERSAEAADHLRATHGLWPTT